MNSVKLQSINELYQIRTALGKMLVSDSDNKKKRKLLKYIRKVNKEIMRIL